MNQPFRMCEVELVVVYVWDWSVVEPFQGSPFLHKPFTRGALRAVATLGFDVKRLRRKEVTSIERIRELQ